MRTQNKVNKYSASEQPSSSRNGNVFSEMISISLFSP